MVNFNLQKSISDVVESVNFRDRFLRREGEGLRRHGSSREEMRRLMGVVR
jgi:hypothetical protein